MSAYQPWAMRCRQSANTGHCVHLSVAANLLAGRAQELLVGCHSMQPGQVYVRPHSCDVRRQLGCLQRRHDTAGSCSPASSCNCLQELRQLSTGLQSVLQGAHTFARSRADVPTAGSASALRSLAVSLSRCSTARSSATVACSAASCCVFAFTCKQSKAQCAPWGEVLIKM